MASRDICPNCGAELPSNARACPECGSDEQTGWSDRAVEERLGIPDSEFNYESFVKEEFGPEEKSRGRPLLWVLGVVVLLILLLIFLFRPF